MGLQPCVDKDTPAGIGIAGKPLLLVGSHRFVDENDTPNIVSPCNDDLPTKRRDKRKSPYRGIGGMVLHLPPPPLPPALQPKCSITPPPTLQCIGIYNGFFGLALTFAVKSMQHTANHFQQWAREPNFGVKSFAHSILSTSQSVCLPYQGVILDWMSDPWEGFIFCAESCGGDCINWPRYSYCVSNINVKKKINNPMIPLSSAPGSRQQYQKKSMNTDLAGMEICMTREGTGICIAYLFVWFCWKQYRRLEQLCQKVLRAIRSGRQLG
jgi:hypothetical protein